MKSKGQNQIEHAVDCLKARIAELEIEIKTSLYGTDFLSGLKRGYEGALFFLGDKDAVASLNAVVDRVRAENLEERV